MKTPEEKYQARLNRVHLDLRTKTPGGMFNKHPNGIACLFQRLVRLRARDKNGNCKCVTCGVVQHWKDMDSGHYISRANKATIIDPRNVHPQCKVCNHRGTNNYRTFMIDTYGLELVQELERTRLPANHVWDRLELAKIKIQLLDEIKELEKSYDDN